MYAFTRQSYCPSFLSFKVFDTLWSILGIDAKYDEEYYNNLIRQQRQQEQINKPMENSQQAQKKELSSNKG